MADGSIPITQIRTLELREADIYSESHTCKSTGPREGSVSLNAVPRANLLERTRAEGQIAFSRLFNERSRKDGQISFSSLFTARSPRGEVIVTFLALLELLRQHRVIIYQNAAFHEITIPAEISRTRFFLFVCLFVWLKLKNGRK